MLDQHPNSRLAAALHHASPPVAPTPVAAAAVAAVVALRPYQEDFVEKVRLEFRAKHKAVLLVAATGAGKTVVFSYIAKSAAEKGSRVLILAHRDQLIKQASRKLTDNGVVHGIIMAGFTPQLRRRVQVASVQTLVRRIEKMKAAEAGAAERARAAALAAGKTEAEAEAAAKAASRALGFDLIVIDECHLSAAASYMAILAAWPEARVLGVTGSPIRLDGKGLGRQWGGTFDVLVQGISIKQLIAEGYLVEPAVYASKMRIELAGVKRVAGDFDKEALADVMDKPVITGSAIEHWKRICPGVPAVAWCVNVAHARHVAEQFNAAGIPALALSGENDSDERDKALAALSNGSIKVITFAMLLVEGVDCPAIGAVILLRPTMSLASYLQTVGRGLRPIYLPGMPLDTRAQRFAAIDAGPKGRKCFVLDHAGMVFRHGLPHEEREWTLEGQVKKPGKKKDSEPAVPIAQCPKCFIVHEPAPACPGCGHVYQVKARQLNEEDGELVVVTEDDAARLKRQRQREVGAARTLEDLKKIAAQRGYRESWAEHVFNARQGKGARP
jgi:superfamily II DNA or RNA helicase